MRKTILLFFLGSLFIAWSSEQKPYDLFFNQLSEHCGNSYPGKLTLEPEGEDMLPGTERLIVHFRECDDDQLKLAFHIELEEDKDWNRSRTWIFTRQDD